MYHDTLQPLYVTEDRRGRARPSLRPPNYLRLESLSFASFHTHTEMWNVWDIAWGWPIVTNRTHSLGYSKYFMVSTPCVGDVMRVGPHLGGGQ